MAVLLILLLFSSDYVINLVHADMLMHYQLLSKTFNHGLKLISYIKLERTKLDFLSFKMCLILLIKTKKISLQRTVMKYQTFTELEKYVEIICGPPETI